MPNILHRLSIDAPPERVHQLAATREGIQQCWTGHAVTGDDKLGGQLSVYFRDPADAAAAIFEVEGPARTKSSGGASPARRTGSIRTSRSL